MKTKTLAVPLIAGFGAHIFLAAVVVALHRTFDVDLIKIWVGPVPFLSFFLSFLASLCFMIGLDENKLKTIDYVYLSSGMIISAICGIILIYFLQYQTEHFSNGQMVSHTLSFKDFLQVISSSSSIKMMHQEASEALQLGQASFLLPAMTSLAYVVGGSWIGFAALRR